VTGGQFREVDFDLLADYVGGALDGPDEAEVSRLIAEDPAWAEAYAALATGVDAVRRDLAALAAEPEPMPPAVVDRLDAALTRPALTGAAGPDESAEREASRAPRRPGRPPTGVPAQPRSAPASPSRGPGRRRRWARRVAGPVLVATVVAGFGAFAVSRFGADGTADQAGGSTYTAGSAPEHAPLLGSGSPRPVPQPSVERVLATGTDYTSRTLAGTVTTLTSRAPTTPQDTSETRVTDQRATPGPAGQPDRHRTGGPDLPETAAPGVAPQRVPGLERLADPAVLARCLEAIAAAHGRGPITVELVDFASFEGRAALVVVFADGTGTRWAWATGPGCGTSPTGADVTYQTRVG
jgi:anti-sigma factor RsiW